jgi:hypothetical protein
MARAEQANTREMVTMETGLVRPRIPWVTENTNGKLDLRPTSAMDPLYG